jgi:hypothetical protein
MSEEISFTRFAMANKVSVPSQAEQRRIVELALAQAAKATGKPDELDAGELNIALQTLEGMGLVDGSHHPTVSAYEALKKPNGVTLLPSAVKALETMQSQPASPAEEAKVRCAELESRRELLALAFETLPGFKEIAVSSGSFHGKGGQTPFYDVEVRFENVPRDANYHVTPEFRAKFQKQVEVARTMLPEWANELIGVDYQRVNFPIRDFEPEN